MTTTGSTTGSTGTREKIVPLVTSDTAGPLGAIHLPRLWAKLSLAAANLLPEGYDECGPGFDQMTLTAMNLDRQKTIDYVRTNRPTYVQFERWVVEQNGGTIDPERIRKHNEAVRGYNHADALAADMRTSCGLTDRMVTDAVTLNKLEDLDELHNQLAGK
ncbi:MAG TPA: hypothetical protein VKT72_00725 [Candidatus Baltobacteraceae bacterium]|nr:hypothetical protein [Candidatus Baltobacteraceae bacterium]